MNGAGARLELERDRLDTILVIFLSNNDPTWGERKTDSTPP